MNDESKKYRKIKFGLKRLIFYIVTLVTLILVLVKFSEIKLIGNIFAHSNIWWLAGIIVSQILSYYFTVLNFRDVLRIKELEVGVKELFPITFIVQFLNQALPSGGLSGQAFFIYYLKKYGLSVAEGISRAILELTTLYMAFGAFFIISIGLMFKAGILINHRSARTLVIGFAIVALILIFVFFALQSRRRGKLTHWAISKLEKFFEKKNDPAKNGKSNVEIVFNQFKNTLSYSELRKHASAFWMAFFWQAMALFANIITLYMIFLALDVRVSFTTAFIAFTLTKFVSMVSFLVPGALGVFEGVMTLTLVAFGVPGHSAFVATLVLRALTFWIQLPIGWMLYRWFIFKAELDENLSNFPGV